MENNDFFRQYKEILTDGFDKVRKSGFKKLPLFREMMDTLEVFINKEAYGRIVPGNYVLLFLLMMGSRNVKLVEVAIRTMQKLISYNYIHENEELSTNLYKEEFREYLLVPPATLKNKSVSEIYLETLMQLQDKDEGLQLLVVKNLSLVVRLFQHSLTSEVIKAVYNYLTEMLISRPGNLQKTIKSTIIQVVRHVLENLRQIDFNILLDNDSWSIRKVCRDELNGIVDQIVLKDAVQKKYGDAAGWRLIPSLEDFESFELQPVEASNEKNQPNGKFGWCSACRQPANYYCKTLRIPVCSFACKNKYLTESQSFDKLLADEVRAQEIFLIHSRLILSCLSEELLHEQQKRRILAIETVNFVLSEPKRFRSIRNHVKSEMSQLFRNCLVNVVAESEAFVGCLLCIKKLLTLGTFVSEAELFFEMLGTKLLSVQIGAQYKIEILRCLKDILNGELVVELFLSLDCEIDRKNSVSNILRSITTVFVGIPVPKEIVFEQDVRVKKLCFDCVTELTHSLGEIGKKMEPYSPSSTVAEKKTLKKEVDQAIVLFNTPDVKPEKAIKRLIHLGAIQDNPDSIARFMHRFMEGLSSVKIGEMVGGHADICKEVLQSFNKLIEFPEMEIDSGLRHLLDHFTLPGESQQVDRIVDSFSHIFYRDNQRSVFAQAGAIYSLSFLSMMLQTNLHNPQVHEKMKLADFTKLAKGMNKGADFPQEYLAGLYSSIQKSQLGFHEKQKEIDFVAAYTQGGRKLQELYQKEIEKLVKRVYSQFKLFGNVKDFRPKVSCLPLLLEVASKSIVEVLNVGLERNEEKEPVSKLLESMEALVALCISHRIRVGQESLVELLSRRVLQDLVSIKQLLITETLLDWAMKFTEWLDRSWKFIFSVISRFSRRKAIVKSKENRKPLLISPERISLQEGWIDSLVGKSAELPEPCALAMLGGLLEVSREQIRDNEVIFCLQKVGDFVEYNLPRTTEIFSSVWPLLRDYYFELGCSPNEKVALFGVDFLKQTITKFMKVTYSLRQKKETLALQKELFKPYEMIFTNTELPAIKEFILSTIANLVTHNSAQLRYGWRVILSILAESFEEAETAEIKAKSYQALTKLIDSNLGQLQEYYIDLTQILVKLTRQKDETYVIGCIGFVRAIIAHYNKKLSVQPKTPNPAVDISFLQATWLPLLGVLSTICGDPRFSVQNEAMNYLFELLMEFGSLFKYEFWKMVFQGVIRPTFDEILYTFQIRGSESRKESQGWLEKSCSKLFEAISELISVYYEDFRLFLPDIFRIYENCTQHANELLTRLSINAVSLLLQKVALKYTEEDWECFLQFFNRLFRKTTPTELTSLEAWQASKASEDYNQSGSCSTKCLSQLMLMGVAEQILEKFSIHLSEKHLEFLYGIIKDSFEFSSNFNKQLDLRSSLWKEGFIPEMKELPGLLRQEREALKCLILAEYYRYQLAQNDQQGKFEQYIGTVLRVLRLYVQKHQELFKGDSYEELERHEIEREALNMRFLVRDTVICQIEENGLNSIVAYRGEFFKAFLDMLRYSSTSKRPCSNCRRCESCQKSKDIEVEFDETLNKLIVGLFNLQS